jgi:hypothetical protein
MKKPKPEKPQSEMSEQERIDEWRRKRAAKPLLRPSGKMMGKQKREVKEDKT